MKLTSERFAVLRRRHSADDLNEVFAGLVRDGYVTVEGELLDALRAEVWALSLVASARELRADGWKPPLFPVSMSRREKVRRFVHGVPER